MESTLTRSSPRTSHPSRERDGRIEAKVHSSLKPSTGRRLICNR